MTTDDQAALPLHETPETPETPESDDTAVSATPDAPDEEALSLSAHRKRYGTSEVPTLKAVATPDEPDESDTDTPETPPERDDQGRFRRRSAKSQATREDVPRIKELTKRLREAERQRDEFKTQLEGNGQPPAPAARPSLPVQRDPEAPATFTEPEPKTDDPKYAQSDDPYRDYVRDWARWDRRREAFEERAKAVETQAQTATQEQMTALMAAHEARWARFHAQHPDQAQRITKAEWANDELTPLLHWTLLTDDESPELALFLAQHPEEFADVQLMTASSTVTESTVAALRRKLHSRRRAAQTTGSAPANPPVVNHAPRPPNPVRTGPLPSGEDPPGEESSLSAHRHFYGTDRRPRRS